VTRPILELRDIVKRYGSALGVGPVSLSVNEGEFLTLLGPSGCGKTTTLHIIAGLLQPDQGVVTMGERDITSLAPPYRDMGLVFQNYALFPHKSVFDNIAFGLRMRKVARDDIARRVARMLEVVGLPGVDARYPDQLSGGQRQRVALARALVIEPGVLLLDEPLSNLDALLRKRMRLELRDIQKRLGITTIFVTHDQDEAFEMSDRVALLNQGRIAQQGAPEALYDAPVSRFVAEFIGEASLLEGRVLALRDGVAEVEIAGGVRLSARPTREGIGVGDSVLVLLRPERIDLDEAPPADGRAIHARIEKRIFSGDRVTFELRTAEGTRIVCNKPSLARFRDLPAERWVWAAPGECRALAAEAAS
jgi:ABC-type Fe3+/spermidine/putrescine transport system ATPase subunit